MSKEFTTKTHWDIGSAYDLFISLRVIHKPDRFGLRASWAAGVRSRLPLEHRQTLETTQELFSAPLHFVHSLPKPKDSEALLTAFAKMRPEKRLEALAFNFNFPKAFKEVLEETNPRNKWTPAQRQIVIENLRSSERRNQASFLDLLYHTWAEREEFGERLLSALHAYVDTFFAEEEQRILPVLRHGLSHAQMRAGSLPLPAMLEEITSGVRYGELEHYEKIYMAPSFWGSPLMFYDLLDHETILILFGARPDTMAIIPGDIVPDALLRGLKSLSDPTRLRILRTLAQAPQTAVQLSRSLRLRPPTVNHHLSELRMSGMVQVILNPEGDRQYATRFDGFESTQDLLNRFIRGD